MATRAHAAEDYSLRGAPERPRRQVWLRDEDYDPVVLPRGRDRSISGVLIASAVLASALVGGGAYAVYRSAPPELSETPTLPLQKNWEVDPAVTQANIAFALRGRPAAPAAASVPPAASDDAGMVAPPVTRAAPTPRKASGDEVRLDDSAPGFQESLPQPTDNAPAMPSAVMPVPEVPILPDSPDAPYPNPTTTPPELSAPPAEDGSSSPPIDSENPYDLK